MDARIELQVAHSIDLAVAMRQKFPEAAIFREDLAGNEFNVWFTEEAAQAAERSGFPWQDYLVDDDSPPPLEGTVRLLIGESGKAWELLVSSDPDRKPM